MTEPDKNLFLDWEKFRSLMDVDTHWDPEKKKYSGVLGTRIQPKPEDEIAEERLLKLFILAKSLDVSREHAAHLAELAMRHIVGFWIQQRGRPPKHTLEELRTIVAEIDEIKKTAGSDKKALRTYNKEHGTNFTASRLSEARRKIYESDLLREQNQPLLTMLIRLGQKYDS